MIKVLIITNDVSLERMLYVTLTINGLSAVTVANLDLARSKMQHQFNIVLVDCNLKENYLDFYQGIEVPVLFLGNPNHALGTNADYLNKPFIFLQLKEKMNLLLARNRSYAFGTVTYQGLKIDPLKQVATFEDRVINLPRMQFAILNTLIAKRGEFICRDRMRIDLQKQGHFFTSTIFQQIAELKNVLKEITGEKFRIKFVLGQGYRLIYE